MFVFVVEISIAGPHVNTAQEWDRKNPHCIVDLMKKIAKSLQRFIKKKGQNKEEAKDNYRMKE